MDIGSFATADQVDRVIAAGGEYAEFFIARVVSTLSAEEFLALERAAQRWPWPIPAFSGLLPAELKVVGDELDLAAQNAYLAETFRRLGRLSGGHAVVVFGSGRSREIPDGFDRDRALDQLEEFTRRATAMGADEGVTVLIEPLNRKECNVFTSVSEAGDFIRTRGLSGTKLLADLYHMMEENEPLSVLTDYADLIAHTHIADTGRRAPGTGSYPLTEFFEVLRSIDYSGRCSIECRWEDFDSQLAPALDYCRTTRRAAGL